MAKILSAVGEIANITSFSTEFAAKQAALAAKKELISIATAIYTAANKGRTSIDYNISSSITRLDTVNLAYAISIIEAELLETEYQFTKTVKGNSISYKIEWEVETEPEGTTGTEPEGTTGQEPEGITGQEPEGNTAGEEQPE